MNTNRRLRYNGRKKAPFGSEEAAILGAAAITAASTTAGAIQQANAAKEAAKQQANATINQANIQAESLSAQNENNNKLQETQQDFIKGQNDENRDIQKQIQMQLQMITGQENMNDRFEASKIQVRNGGIRGTKQSPTTLLRGGNIGFNVTDGGYAIPRGVTQEGYNLYELAGNDHEHYHKTKNGKNKTGVGIRFSNGEIVEGEGNQGTSNGELLLTTPYGGYFISKHTIDGFNPAKAVKSGMNPLDAVNVQENIKDIKGISDDGKTSTKSSNSKHRRLRLAGGIINGNFENIYGQSPDFSTDIINPAISGIIYSDRNKAKIGKIVSMPSGGWGVAALNDYQFSNLSKPNLNKLPTISGGNNGGISGGNNGRNWLNKNANLVGAGINTVANIVGGLITSSANNKASNILSDAYTNSSKIVADAYRNMKGVDMSSIKQSDYAAQHYMPAIRSAYYNINPELSAVERSAARKQDAVKKNTLSSAAMLSRLNRIESDLGDNRMRLYGEKGNREETIKQANNAAINQAAAKNAELDIAANKDYLNARLDLLKYNNDIENQKLAGIAEAESSGLVNSAGVNASTIQSNANGWASALSNSALGFSNSLVSMAKQRNDINNSLLGASTDSTVNYIAINGTRAEKAKQLNAIRAALNSGKLSKDDEAKYRYYESLLK